jgi:hypothetical protein
VTSFGLTACSAVYYQDPHCRFLQLSLTSVRRRKEVRVPPGALLFLEFVIFIDSCFILRLSIFVVFHCISLLDIVSLVGLHVI